MIITLQRETSIKQNRNIVLKRDICSWKHANLKTNHSHRTQTRHNNNTPIR